MLSTVTNQPASSPVPWNPGQATQLLVLDIVGGAVLIGGWLGTSGTSALGRQLAWVSVAVVGLLLAGTGNALWLLAGRRSVGVRLAALMALRPEGSPRTSEVQIPPVSLLTSGPVAVAKGARYHHSDCLLVRGKPAFAVTSSVRKRRALQPCEVCRPEVDA